MGHVNDDWFFEFIQDDRAKLLECQKERMQFEREDKGIPYRLLGQRFGVSTKMAWMICNYSAYEKSKEAARLYQLTSMKDKKEMVIRATKSRSKKREFKKSINETS